MIVLFTLLVLLSLPVILFGIITAIKPFWIVKTRAHAGFIILAGFLLFIFSIVGGFSNVPDDVKVTPEVYKGIKEGITYEEMIEKIGGEPKSENKIGEDILEYKYDGENGVEDDATVYFLFSDGKLDTKVELGLITKNEPDKKSKQEQKPVDESVDADTGDKPEISEHAKKMAVDFITDDPLVKDAHIEVEGDKVTIAIVVNAAMNEERAKEVGDNFVRFLNTMVDGTEPATKHYLGSLWDHYDLHVGVGTGPDNFIVQGAKVAGAKRIMW